MRRLGGVLKASWGVSETSWARLGMSWEPFGPSCGRLGDFVGCLRVMMCLIFMVKGDQFRPPISDAIFQSVL